MIEKKVLVCMENKDFELMKKICELDKRSQSNCVVKALNEYGKQLGVGDTNGSE